MFDFAWSELAVIAAVALVLIGPKDMPVAIRAVTDMIKKARRMAGEFQSHVDEMMREANLDDIKNSINEIRNFDLKGEVERQIDPDGSLRSTFAENPLEPHATPEVASEVAAEPVPELTAEAPVEIAGPELPQMPAFLPPSTVAPAMVVPDAADDAPPAFVPPDIVRTRNG